MVLDKDLRLLNGTAYGITKAMVGLGNCDNTSDANKPISIATQTALHTLTSNVATKAPIRDPTFLGTINGRTLSIGDGLFFANAIGDLTCNTLTLTGNTVTGITKAMVGLGNCDNTSDAKKTSLDSNSCSIRWLFNTSESYLERGVEQ